MSESPALEIDNLTKRYRTGTVAVDQLSLTVPKGAFFGFLGPNGAGKTTTISCIVGTAKITSGSVKVFGLDVEKDYRAARGKVGIAPQEFNVDIFMKIEDNLDFVAGFYGIPKAKRKKRIEELLERYDLVVHRDKAFQALSGGLKRRFMLARAMVHDPDLIILDEPTSGVDVELRHSLWDYFKQLNQEGKTIILTSHYLEEVEMLADTIAIVNKGKIIANGAKAEFTKNGGTLEDEYLKITKGEVW